MLLTPVQHPLSWYPTGYRIVIIRYPVKRLSVAPLIYSIIICVTTVKLQSATQTTLFQQLLLGLNCAMKAQHILADCYATDITLDQYLCFVFESCDVRQ
jgi:hypothetical protein